MADTNHLLLPLMSAAQSQKHLTHNDAIIMLDALVQLAVIDRDLATPPASPSEGDRYIAASGAAGAWVGSDFNIFYYTNGAWTKIVPKAGFLAWVVDEQLLVFWNGSSWAPVNAVTDLAAQVVTANGAGTGITVVDELLTVSGASTTSTISFPNRSIIQAASVRVVTAVTGATSFDCGITGELNKFGGSLGIAAGSTNVGVIGPTAVYANTPVILTANGSNFTGGEVRVALHYVTASAPSS
jgi:hypothetical protein